MRDRESAHAWKWEEGQRERIFRQTPPWAWSPNRVGSHHPEIMTRAETKSWTLYWLSHSGTPRFIIIYICFMVYLLYHIKVLRGLELDVYNLPLYPQFLVQHLAQSRCSTNFKKIICLFIRDSERERQRHRQREKQTPARSPMWDSIQGLQDHDRSWKQTLDHWATQASCWPPFLHF